MADQKITLELGEKSIRLAQARVSAGKIDVSCLDLQSDSPPFYEIDTQKILEDESKMISDLISRNNLGKKNVNLVIPDTYTYSQIVEMPFLKEKELLSAIRYQADQFIPTPLDQTSLDLDILAEDKANKKLKVLIVAAPQSLIAKIEKMVQMSNLFAESVENELSATSRLLDGFFRPSDIHAGTVFVNFGYSSCSCYFFHHSMRLILDVHNFKIGYALFLKELKANTTFELEKAKEILKNGGFTTNSAVPLDEVLRPTVEAFTSEIKKYLQSIKEKYQIERIANIYLLNFAKDISAFDKKISRQFEIPTSLFNITPFTKPGNLPNRFVNEISSFTTAIGGCL